MRVICISDTHEQHRQLQIPDGDLLIHAGDITYSGEPHAIRDFLSWFCDQPHKHKIFIAGNHDFWFEEATKELFPNNKKWQGLTFLNDDGCEIDGFKIWGSPITPTFGNWAFMRPRGDSIAEVWHKIPLDTDILITHGPPQNILDLTPPRWGSKNAGCYDLAKKVAVVAPKLHVFGHIHHGYGRLDVNFGKGKTVFVNASSCNEEYDPVNPPIVVDL